ncbi:short-chain dehydrogenase [Gammaproteobacteria bacterium 2W06]|nr:short-chain dehydrogenase [Gammaproteobacteria bacterium 2W06]
MPETPQRAETKPVILITGCSTGIGRHCAFAMQRHGWRVFATARQPQDVEALQHDGLDDALRLDVDDDASIQRAVDTLLGRTNGRIDAVFNNAGFGQPGAVEDLPREALRAQFETNVLGAQAVIRTVLPAMRAQGHGRIVQHSSVLGFIGLPWRGAYNASKYALEGLTDTLRQELGGSGIEAVLIQTGPVTSHFRATGREKFERWIDPSASVHQQSYQAVIKRLEGAGDPPFTLGAEAVARKLRLAVESVHPKPRYHVTVPTHVFKALRRLLPTRALDTVIRRVNG